MTTSTCEVAEQVRATDVHFESTTLCLELSDGRELRVPTESISWLSWLANATPEQRSGWSIEPGGYAVYWDELDDGVEVCHLLGMQPVA